MSFSTTQTWTATPTFTASPTATATPKYLMKIAVYNSAGETVKEVALSGSYSIPENFTLSNTVFSPDDGSYVQISVDQTVVIWNGTNQQNARVENGLYFIKVEIVDSYGYSHTMIQQVTVLTNSGKKEFLVYNSAGEIVKRIPVNYLIETGSTVLNVNSGVFSPGNGGVKNYAEFTYMGQSIKWDGTNDKGDIVGNGVYRAVVATVDNNAYNAIAETNLTVLHDAYEVLTNIRVLPNPINDASHTVMKIRYDVVNGTVINAKIYNLAGELVKVMNDYSNAGEVQWDLSAERQIAHGLYVAVIYARTQSGMSKTAIIKFTIMR